MSRPLVTVSLLSTLLGVAAIAFYQPPRQAVAAPPADAKAMTKTEVPTFNPGRRTAAARVLARDAGLRKRLEELPVLERLEESLPSVEVDGQTYYVAEGDLLKDEDQLLIYAAQRTAQLRAFEARMLGDEVGLASSNSFEQERFLGILVDGRVLRWAPGTVLTYCVLSETFPNDEQYEEVVDLMAEATGDWEELCGVDFHYLPEHDESEGTGTPQDVLFSVRHINAGGDFIASAFFPDDPRSRRRILIDPSFFTTRFDQTGVLRHELGHVLGVRHEHIRSGAPARCPTEDIDGTFEITDYDPQSVMHYFCGGVGDLSLEFTELDREGAQFLYGPPLETFRFVSFP